MSNCIVITYLYPLDDPGGGTRSCREIARCLAQLNQEVILVPVSNETECKVLWDSVTSIPVAPNSIHHILNGIGVAQKIRQILKTKKIVDAVISWSYEGAFLPILLKSRQVTFGTICAAPSYEAWMKRDNRWRWFNRLVDNWFRWRTYRSSDVLFVSSEFTRQELISLLQVNPERIKITHRGIDPLFSQVKRSQAPEQITNFIFYGSLAPIKGVFDTIDALGNVAAQGYRNWTLKIAGWGDEDAVLEAVKHQNIEKHLVLLGCLAPEELAQELKWAHLAILPSRAESFGRAISEAQASGLAVVSYNIGSIPEIIEDGLTGWLVPFKRVDLIADAIIEAMQYPKKTFQMGIKGKEVVTQKFSWEKTALSILEGIEIAKQQI